MTIQDDQRENELIELFDLENPGDGRSGIDAILNFMGNKIPFELKSTTTGSVTTVRDFGPHYQEKWKDKHWLIGVYAPNSEELVEVFYGTPQMVKPWIDEKVHYVLPDFLLIKAARNGVDKETLYEILGEKVKYSLSDAKKIQKRQYSKSEYLDLMDREEGYSENKMIEILRDRVEYVISRGATLNNPHIPKSYFQQWNQIQKSHSEELRRYVELWLGY